MARTYSDFAHIPIALGVAGVTLGLSLVSLLAAAAFAAVAVCFMREATQAEYTYIAAHGGLRANMPHYQGIKFWLWDKHSILETLYPLIPMAVAVVPIVLFTPIR